MAIYRGAGGSGDAVADTSNESVTAIAAAAAALASQTAAAASASSAATSASSATTSASNASSSASSASSSASSASTSASNAATSETNAATSASNAATSASDAATTAATFTPSQTGNAGKYLTTDGTSTSWGTVVSASGTVTSVTGTAPVSVATGTTTPVISMLAATTSVNGYLTSTDWTTFNGKQDALGFTPYNATNPSGYTSNTGTVTSVAASAGTGISITGSPITASGTFNITNTAPDQVVSLTGAGTTTVTGTYPNFTITSTGGGGSGTVTSVSATVPTGLAISGSPITTSGTLDITYAAGYAIPTTASQTNWDTAFSDRLKWDGGSTGLTASTGRTSLGVTATGVDTTYAYRANNLSDLVNASTARTNLGLAIGTNVLAYDSNLQSFVNTFTLPTTDSTSGYVLSTNGTGTLSWIANGSGGSSNLDGLSDVVLTSPTTGQVLKYNGTNWVNDTDSTGSGSFAYPTGTGIVVVSSGTSWGTTLTAPSGTIVGTSDTQTLTNKRITARVSTTTSSTTPTINTDNVEFYGLTAQAVDITSFTTNLTGTPTDGQRLWIYIVGTAARAITWGASFESSTATLPTTTVNTNRLDVGFVWNTVTSKWRCVAVA